MANNKIEIAELKIENLKLNYVIDSIINDTYEVFKLSNENWAKEDIKKLYKTRADTAVKSIFEGYIINKKKEK